MSLEDRDSLKKAKTEQHAKEKLADFLFKEAENKMKKAVQTGDVTDISVAQILLETAQLKRAEEIERQLKQQTTYKNGLINARLHCWTTSLKPKTN